MIGLKLVYVANVLVAGWISLTCLFYSQYAHRYIFYDVDTLPALCYSQETTAKRGLKG